MSQHTSAPLRHTIALTPCPWSCVLREKAANTNFIVFGLTQPGIKPMIYYTRGKHLVWPNQGSNPWSITLVVSTWFDPTRDQTHDLLHSWQALGLTQPGIKPMIYYTRGKHANDYTTDAGYWMSCISWSWYNSKS